MLAAAVLFGAASSTAAEPDPLVARGRALYFNTGNSLDSANPQIDGAPVPAGAAACVSCHRRSGLGSAEGTILVPPIAGDFLFNPLSPQTGRRLPWPSRDRTRPAYTTSTLAVALRHGQAPDGVRLNGPMPRYGLADADVAALAAYLRALSTGRAPGVSDDEVVLATITTPDVPAAEVGDLLGVLDAFFADKNAGTRGETRRRTQALRNDDTMYRRYRRWRLVHWALSGEPASWQAQLERRYAETPVFAVLSGISYDTWQPVHSFCEAHGVPCLLPMAWMPPQTEGFYSLYFAPGITGQARAIAQTLARDNVREVVAWTVQSSTGERQRSEIRTALAAHGIGLADRDAREGDVVLSAVPRVESRERSGDGRARLARLYVLDRPGDALPDRWSAGDWSALQHVTLVTDLASAETARRQLPRSRMWVSSKRLTPSSERVAVNALLAATIAVETLMHVDDKFTREYCIEKLEHNLENMPPMTAYPRLAIGPGQRFATRRYTFVSQERGE
jgi:hypothetical protein